MSKTQATTNTIFVGGVDPDAKREFKAICAREGVSMNKVLRDFVVAIVDGKIEVRRSREPGSSTS